MPGRLLIRADASAEIGAGHVMRCLALGQAWQELGGSVTFASAFIPAALQRRLQVDGMQTIRINIKPGSWEDVATTSRLASEVGATWIVADGYLFDGAYQQGVREGGRPLLLWDDYGHAEHYFADVVLNQNVSADPTMYARRENGTRLLLGTRFAVLRREFRVLGECRIGKQPDVARRVLVTLGGSDPDNVTLRIAEALASADAPVLDVVVVGGVLNDHISSIREAAAQSVHSVRVELDVARMAELMAWADVAVSAGGSTCLELAYMGVPNLVVVVAENQRRSVEELEDAGASINLGWHSDVSRDNILAGFDKLLHHRALREQMACRGRELVDGRGAERVCGVIKSCRLMLRPVSDEDCELLWKWANEPSVRAASFSSEPISLDTHRRWFREKVMSDQTYIYIAQDSFGNAAGQIRFDLDGPRATVDASLDRSMRGRGLGQELIWQGTRTLLEATEVQAIDAYVKVENEPSIRAFDRAGYRLLGESSHHGIRVLHYVWSRRNDSDA